jgi:hypothetical protein
MIPISIISSAYSTWKTPKLFNIEYSHFRAISNKKGAAGNPCGTPLNDLQVRSQNLLFDG